MTIPTIMTYTAALAALYPATYAAWHQRTFNVGTECYQTAPLTNCSMRGHAIAPSFAAFIAPYLTGRVLDIGCGPYPKPLYLEGYPDNLIWGIDPLPPFELHPFAFMRGVAEFLPWPDATFDTVITATSLDHVLDLDLALAELARVLKPGGLYLCWEHINPHSPPYNPDAPHPFADQYHLFKLGLWLGDMLAVWFDLEAQAGEYTAWRKR